MFANKQKSYSYRLSNYFEKKKNPDDMKGLENQISTYHFFYLKNNVLLYNRKCHADVYQWDD